LADHILQQILANLLFPAAMGRDINVSENTRDDAAVAAMTRALVAMQDKAMIANDVDEFLESAV